MQPSDVSARPLEFGWFLPSAGDTTCLGESAMQIPPSLELMDRVVDAAERAGFSYLLVPVGPPCWEGWVTASVLVGRSTSIKMLVAARPGYIAPFLMAKMISTFDRLSGGRICVNLIAGQSEAETLAEGVTLPKEDRYDLMEEEVRILKELWASENPVDIQGRFHTLEHTVLLPKPHQRPHPRLYLGGGSSQAWDISAEHADVHLFWGDTYERIESNIAEIRRRAAVHGRREAIEFGMRLQIVCREREDEAWEAANELVRGVTDERTARVHEHYSGSEANRRVQELARTHGDTIEANLWTGITRVRPGAGIAIVGNPTQCADVIQRYIDLGCTSFCLSGYLHDEEATRFAEMVRPLLRERNAGRMN